jgi:hypothetical protein
MFTFRAPLPALQATLLLPNPLFGDSEALTAAVEMKRAMNGTVRTYVKTKNGRRRLQWTFRMTRNKGLEMRAFLLRYFASEMLVEDHNGRTWRGTFVNNPFEFDTPRKAGPAITPMPRGEQQEITVEFEGVEVV